MNRFPHGGRRLVYGGAGYTLQCPSLSRRGRAFYGNPVRRPRGTGFRPLCRPSE